jgi:phasin family protein
LLNNKENDKNNQDQEAGLPALHTSRTPELISCIYSTGGETMFTSPEQFASATKTLFEFQLMTFNALTSKAVKGVEQVVALNMSTAKSHVEDTIATGKDITEAKDPKAAMEIVAAQVRPGVDSVKAYNHQLGEIIREIHQEFTSAADAHLAEAKTNLSALIYDVTQNVRPGSPDAVKIVKAAIDNAFLGYEQVSKATRQAVLDVETRIAKAAEEVARATGTKAAAASQASAVAPDAEQDDASADGDDADPAPKERKSS